MHICYVADARSPIAKNWISYFVARNHRVTVLSSYPCSADEIPGARIIEFPLALSSLLRLIRPAQHGQSSTLPNPNGLLSGLLGHKSLEAAHLVRTFLASFNMPRKAAAMSALLDDLKPDIVHAMRLPFEGYTAASAVKRTPLVLSVWGNDFTLFADSSRRLDELTNSSLRRADALHCDCNRDLNLAFARGFARTKPWRVLPGNGGIQDYFFEAVPDRELLCEYRIPENVPLVINPRGFRTYVQNESFFKAIPLVLKRVPNAFFIETGMLGNPTAEHWVRQLNIVESVRLLPTVSREQLASLFAAAQVSVSPSSHDGTPNTLLEAMAAQGFPVAGNIESVREWIADGENGLLCDPRDPNALATCIVRALQDSDLRTQAIENNKVLVKQRARYQQVMENAEFLYKEILAQSRKAKTLNSMPPSECAQPEPAMRRSF